jgi:adenosylhomocysteine nucleosidase
MKKLILVALPEELDAKLVNCPVIYTGVGLSNAAMMTYDAIIEHSPDLIINYGSAGSLKNYTGLLTVGRVCQRDADCSPLRERGYMLGENILYYHSGEDGVDCGSGNNFVTKPDTWTLDHCDIVDMELWSIAKVCEFHKIPWISRKWISDNADSAAGHTWEENVALGQAEFIKWYNSGK